MGDAGTASGRFTRAIQRGNLLAAEMAARELGGLSLENALALTMLIASEAPDRYERAALRWLERFVSERATNLSEVVFAAVALQELRADARRIGHEKIIRLLRR